MPCTPSDEVTRDALEAISKFPDKRVIVHYMQPHFPFVRDEHLQFAQWHTFSEAFEEFESVTGGQDANVSDVWGALAQGLVDYADVWAGYRRNLECALNAIEDLLSELNTRVIITSDHGNLAGERM